jgi:hypothetical protein
MQTWLYQMSDAIWPVSQYRLEVKQGELIRWRTTNIPQNKGREIAPGDAIVLFYAPTGNDNPGVYGWGVIVNYNPEQDRLDFQVNPPSDYLKMDPLWDDEIRILISKVRGKVAQGTLWAMSNNDFDTLRSKIRHRVSGG